MYTNSCLLPESNKVQCEKTGKLKDDLDYVSVCKDEGSLDDYDDDEVESIRDVNFVIDDESSDEELEVTTETNGPNEKSSRRIKQ